MEISFESIDFAPLQKQINLELENGVFCLPTLGPQIGIFMWKGLLILKSSNNYELRTNFIAGNRVMYTVKEKLRFFKLLKNILKLLFRREERN